MNDEKQLIAEKILLLATNRGNTKTICPSEVAREMWPNDWRRHMPEVRESVFALRDKGQIRIMQKGEDVSGTEITGPIRIQII